MVGTCISLNASLFILDAMASNCPSELKHMESTVVVRWGRDLNGGISSGPMDDVCDVGLTSLYIFTIPLLDPAAIIEFPLAAIDVDPRLPSSTNCLRHWRILMSQILTTPSPPLVYRYIPFCENAPDLTVPFIFKVSISCLDETDTSGNVPSCPRKATVSDALLPMKDSKLFSCLPNILETFSIFDVSKSRE